MPLVLDQIDLKILNVMQKDASLSSAELASRVGLSQSPCWRRIQRLRDEGYIKSVVALLDDEKLGINMYIFAQLKMRTLDDDERERFRHEVDKIPEVLECWTVFGDTDCMLKVLAPDVKWYQDFIFYVLLKLPGVIDISSIVTLTDTKKTNSPASDNPSIRPIERAIGATQVASHQSDGYFYPKGSDFVATSQRCGSPARAILVQRRPGLTDRIPSMPLTRRALFAAAAIAPATSGEAVKAGLTDALQSAPLLPARSAFAAMPTTYLVSGSTHPMPLGARRALEEYLRFKTKDGSTPNYSMRQKQADVVAGLARLIGASPDELCITQSTTMGENLVLKAMGFPQTGGRIVTDALHFFGSFYTYGELKKAGMDVVTLGMTADGRIDMDEMEVSITGQTKLVSISLVSTVNGFEHDLKKICDIAHARGAYVYADIVHAAGAIPVDLRSSGVDFASTSSYKWLMGDFGLGFLYVRKEIQDRLPRPWWGYEQVSVFQSHVFPYDERGGEPATYRTFDNATGHFGMGTTSWTGIVNLSYSIPWILEVGVEQLQAHRQPLVDTVQSELRRRGYQPLTPLDSRTQLVAFALKDARAKLADPLARASVAISVSANRFRISVAAFNDENDIDRLLSALPAAPPS